MVQPVPPELADDLLTTKKTTVEHSTVVIDFYSQKLRIYQRSVTGLFFAMANLAAHAALFTSYFPSSFARSLCTHLVFSPGLEPVNRLQMKCFVARRSPRCVVLSP